MKVIVFSTESLARGGKERQISILSQNLNGRKIRVNILAKKKPDLDSFLKEYDISEDQLILFQDLKDFKNKLGKLKPDIVVSWDIQTSFYNLLLYQKLKFRFINGSIRHGIRLLKPSHLLRSIICHLSPFVIANSFAGLKANNLKPGKRRFVLYNGIEYKFHNNLTKSEIDDLRKKLIPGYKENPGFIFISVARFVPYKEYFTVLKALARLKGDFLFYYLILGDGPMRDEIEKSIRKHELDKRVILAGRTENVRDYLFASDVMIHSSRGEGISNAILEGMYAGLPVIATNVGGIPETVYPASSMLFPYKDHEALYQCLLKSRELKSSFDPDSEDYKKHLAKFSVEAMVQRFEEIIEIVTKERN